MCVNGSKNKRVSLKDTLISKFSENFIFLFIFIIILIFVLWPIISVILNSLYIDDNFTFNAYREVINKKSNLLYNSIFVASLSTAFAIMIAVLIAFFLTQTNLKGKKIIYSILLVSMISPPFVDSLAFIILFGRRGLITYKLLHLNLSPYGWKGIVLIQTLGSIPMATLLIATALKAIDKNIIHSSQDLGAPALNTLFRIIVPTAKSGIIVAILISFVSNLADFGTPIIIGGGYNVLATEAYLNVTGASNLPLASAMSVFLLIPSLIFFIIYRLLMKKNKMFSYHSFRDNNLDKCDIELPKWFKNIIILITMLFALITVLKYATIFMGSIVTFKGREISFTLEYFKYIDRAKLNSFKRSISYSFIAAMAGSILGIFISYIVERNKIKGSKALDFIAMLPYMIPGTFFGVGYILAFNNHVLMLVGTSSIVVLNCIFKELPVSSKAGSTILSQINPEIESAAKDVGANNFYLLKDIIFPMMKPAFLVSFINIFTKTMVTIGALIFLISPGKEVATVQLFSAIREGNLEVGCILANMIIIITLVVNISLTKFLKEK